MNTLTLTIANRNYSSWSLRAWLALPAMHDWVAKAEAEEWKVERYDR